MTKQVVNIVTNERWYCPNLNDTLTIDEKKFVKVHRGNPMETVLMNRDSLVEVITNEQTYENRTQING